MTRERYGDAWVCQDCYFAHHYGSYAMMLSDDGDLDGPLDPGELDYLRANSPQRIIWFAGEDGDEPVGGWWEIQHNHSLEHNREPLWALEGFEVFDNTCSDHYYDQKTENFDVDEVPCDQCGQTGWENGIQDFSWSACDGCHSPLGGSRYRLSLWKREEVTT